MIILRVFGQHLEQLQHLELQEFQRAMDNQPKSETPVIDYALITACMPKPEPRPSQPPAPYVRVFLLFKRNMHVHKPFEARKYSESVLN